MGGGCPKMSYCQRNLLDLLSLFLFPSLPPESYFNYSETAGKAAGGELYIPPGNLYFRYCISTGFARYPRCEDNNAPVYNGTLEPFIWSIIWMRTCCSESISV